MLRAFHHFFTLVLLAAVPASAQDAAPTSISYRITSLVPLHGKTFANSANGTRFEIAKQHVSNPIKAELRDGVFLDFFKKAASAETPPAFSVEIPNPSAGGDLLVIILSAEGGIKYQLLDLKALRIPGGGQYVYNLLPSPVGIQCGDKAKPVIIQGMQQKVVPAPNADKVIQYFFYKNDMGKSQRFSSSLYFKDEETRHIVFCHRQDGAKFPRLSQIAIYDRQPEELTEETVAREP